MNMHPGTLRVAADLMEKGSDLPTLYQKALVNKSFEAARFWGAGLSTLQKEDGLLWATLTLEDRKAIGYPGKDDADLVNVLSSVNGVDIAIIFVEQPKEIVKVSWRAQQGFDVSDIASHFGGGGHKPAAGAEIKGNLDSVKTEVLNATRSYLSNH
jgi:phosphoesterase RecJ-like protein